MFSFYIFIVTCELLGRFRFLVVGRAEAKLRDLGGREACHRQMEAEVVKRVQLEGQKCIVPGGVQRNLIIGDAQRVDLVLCQAGDRDGRRFLVAIQLGGIEPAMPRNDFVVRVEQDGHVEAELADGGGQLRHLFAIDPALGKTVAQALGLPEQEPTEAPAQDVQASPALTLTLSPKGGEVRVQCVDGPNGITVSRPPRSGRRRR